MKFVYLFLLLGILFAVIVLVFTQLNTKVESPEQFFEEKQSEMNFLGRRLLRSLKEDNLAAFLQCWVSPEVASHLEGISFEQDDAEYYAERDYFIESCFRLLQIQINQMTDEKMSQVTVESVKGKFVEMADDRFGNTVLITGDLVVTLRVNAEVTLQLHMGDGFFMGGCWYFSDKPEELNLFKNGEKIKSIDIDDLLKKQMRVGN